MYLVRTAVLTRSTPKAEVALSHLRELLEAGQSPVVTDISGKVLTPAELEDRLDRRARPQSAR